MSGLYQLAYDHVDPVEHPEWFRCDRPWPVPRVAADDVPDHHWQHVEVIGDSDTIWGHYEQVVRRLGRGDLVRHAALCAAPTSQCAR